MSRVGPRRRRLGDHQEAVPGEGGDGHDPGRRRRGPRSILSAGHIRIGTSKDEVGAPLFYREVNLPFVDAVKDPTRIRWRFGTISSTAAAAGRAGEPARLRQLPFVLRGRRHAGHGRGLRQQQGLVRDHAGRARRWSWPRATSSPGDDYRREDGEQTFGLLSQISPDGRYVVSTVKDRSVFVPKPDLAFSQLFFPIKGILGVYDRQTGDFPALPGADDPEVRAEQSRLEPGRQVHRLRPEPRPTISRTPEAAARCC